MLSLISIENPEFPLSGKFGVYSKVQLKIISALDNIESANSIQKEKSDLEKYYGNYAKGRR